MNFDVEKWKAGPTIKTWMTEIREGLTGRQIPLDVEGLIFNDK
jgi:hypothetical protein